MDDGPKPKRARKASGKAATTVKHEEHESDVESDDKPLLAKPTRRSKSSRGRESAVKDKAESEEAEEDKPDPESEAVEETPAPVKPARGRKSAGKVKAASEKHEADPLPARTSRSRKVKTESKGGATGGDTAAPAPAKRGRRSSAKAAE